MQPPPPLPAWIHQFPDLQREAIRGLAGQHEVSEGGVPRGVTAASAIQLLQGADNTRLSAPAKLGKAGLETLARRVLVTIAERWREERLISTFGRDKAAQVMALKGADIGDRDVVVELTEGVEDSDTVRQQQFADWLGVGLFSGAIPMPIALSVLRAIGQGWLADKIEEALPQVEAEQAMAMAQEQAMMDEESAAVQEQEQAGHAAKDAEMQHQAAEGAEQRAHEERLQQMKGQNALAVAKERKPAPAKK
jgi:hypothetical protein